MANGDAAVRGRSVRLFQSDFLEWFSRTTPTTVAACWAPLSLALLAIGLSLAPPSAAGLAALLIGVALGWTLFEYLFHRLLFHALARLEGGRQIAFILHGCHHADPADATRLVMPPPVSLGVLAAFLAPCLALLPLALCLQLAGLFGLAYLTYDMTHYACHRLPMRNPLGRVLKRHHLLHHYRDSGANFSVTFPFWDRVFGTFRRA